MDTIISVKLPTIHDDTTHEHELCDDELVLQPNEDMCGIISDNDKTQPIGSIRGSEINDSNEHNIGGVAQNTQDESTISTNKNVPPTVIDLCSGCGGNALALKKLGFEDIILIESNQRCVNTLRANGFDNVVHSKLEDMEWGKYEGTTIITGGLPCQPWSIGGVHMGEYDVRNLWREAVRAVRITNPELFLFEMVNGFQREKFSSFRDWILSQLNELGYTVEIKRTNAQDLGLTQNRLRCMIIGHKAGGTVDEPKSYPKPKVLRELLKDLGKPDNLNWHNTTAESQSYKGHRPSSLDGLSKTIRAGGGRGPGGGNNTLQLDDGTIRYFTIREMARIQGFPDTYAFDPVWSHAVSELGNACPPQMIEAWLSTLLLKLLRPVKQGLCRVLTPSINEEIIKTKEELNKNKVFEEESNKEPNEEEPSKEFQDMEHDESNDDQKERQELIQNELKRRSELINTLMAQVYVLRDSFMKLMEDVGKDQESMAALVQRIKSDAEWIEASLGGSANSLLAAINEDRQVSDELVNRPDIKRAAKSATAMTKAMKSLTREHKLHKAFSEEATLSEAKRAYLQMIDTTLVRDPGDECEFHIWDTEKDSQVTDSTMPSGRKIFFKMPKSELQSESDEDSEPFFNVNTINPDGVDSDDELNDRSKSLQASLVLEDQQGNSPTVDSVVDTGAAHCALRLQTLRSKLPGLEKLIQPCKRKFHDAQGNRMPIAGRVPLRIWVGTRRLMTHAYVFEKLGAEFLLGINTMRKHKCTIDLATHRLYAPDDPEQGVPVTSCSGCKANSPPWEMCTNCSESSTELQCDIDNGKICVVTSEGVVSSCPCKRSVFNVRLVNPVEQIVSPGQRLALGFQLEGVPKGYLAPIHMSSSKALEKLGLDTLEFATHNPTNQTSPVIVSNNTDLQITIPKNLVAAYDCKIEEEDTVMMAAVLDTGPQEMPPDIDNGGIEWLKERGFDLDKSIDPESRLADGEYPPLPDAKKRILYEIALRHYQAWSLDAKVPKISYLVVIDIPTGTSRPVTQQPYPIPAKLRKAAMDEIHKLLKSGLIEPSMSDWASPALVRVKKDSTIDDVKIKFAIDYRRVNAVTELDAGGLGTQSDILYGVGGKYKYLGLCDAAGGFYQYLLAPKSRAKSAFILPAAMGGTLFQWRVAPYGLTRNPAGYSRGMQWVLKGMHELSHLGDDTKGKGGATSWLDDICMRATTFNAFSDLFDLVLGRLAMAGMTLKGAKCELLHAKLDLLGFVATPHGLMLQKPKLSEIMKNGVPTSPKSAMSFLGAVAFLRRMVPRISLLAAPMINATKLFEKRHQPQKSAKSRKLAKDKEFNDQEQSDVTQSWNAIVEHLDGDAVLAAPDFEDPLAHFVICTDASDHAVGGVLMQWQHKDWRGPGPPKGVSTDPGKEFDKNGKVIDPLDSHWRRAAGWELKVISYYSKTLDSSQRNYVAFDKEAGAALVCCRQWADLITYHPTTLYTDSSVASSMLTKHMAPPRLQRWGTELGSFLPHLRISYRKGSDNGLADLLSRFPTFAKFTATRNEIIKLPDDYFDYIGTAPLFHRIPSTRGKEHLYSSTYELYEPKVRGEVIKDTFWLSHDAPEIPGRGMKDRVPKVSDESSLVSMMEALHDEVSTITSGLLDEESRRIVEVFIATQQRPPTFKIDVRTDTLFLEELIDMLGGQIVDNNPDIVITTSTSMEPHSTKDYLRLTLSEPDYTPRETIQLEGHNYALETEFDLTTTSPTMHTVEYSWASVIFQCIGHLLTTRFGVPDLLHNKSFIHNQMIANWSSTGYGQRIPSPTSTLEVTSFNSIFSVNTTNLNEEEPEDPVRNYPWQDGAHVDKDAPPIDPTDKITIEQQRKDPKLRVLIEALEDHPHIPKTTKQKTAEKYELQPDALYRIVLTDGEASPVLVVPRHARAAILALHHYTLTDGGGHVGGQTMYDQIRLSYYWPDMERECHAFVAACEICGQTRSQGVIGASLAAAPTPSTPFEVIHVDHKGPLPMSGGFTHVLVVVCALTRFTLYIPVTDVTGKTTLAALEDRVFSIFGPPLVIISDNAFASKLMKASENLYGYRHIFVLPYTPQANGLAETAVKRLKLILDRHTLDYQGWHLMMGRAQSAVNQRVNSSSSDCPFAALFGRRPVTLTALENPNLLPEITADDRTIKSTAEILKRIYTRVQHEVETTKQTAVNSQKQHHQHRQVQIGDKIWLTYSDADRARYIRKHGHGKAWRHAYTVERVKPHAVRLTLPKDGSVPDVLPWQSLRKCAFAAPYFHDDYMLLPDTADSGLPIIQNATEAQQNDAETNHDKASQDNGWSTWSSEKKYEVERIVSAETIGNGWRLSVKWSGYPDATPEALHKILKQVKDPIILNQIKQCQEDYLTSHPTERVVSESTVIQPDKIQPQRQRTQPLRFMYMTSNSENHERGLQLAARELRTTTQIRVRANNLLRYDVLDTYRRNLI